MGVVLFGPEMEGQFEDSEDIDLLRELVGMLIPISIESTITRPLWGLLGHGKAAGNMSRPWEAFDMWTIGCFLLRAINLFGILQDHWHGAGSYFMLFFQLMRLKSLHSVLCCLISILEEHKAAFSSSPC